MGEIPEARPAEKSSAPPPECAYQHFSKRICRELPLPGDSDGYCIFHSKDPNKRSQFEEALRAKTDLYYRGYVIPAGLTLNFRNKEFNESIDFSWANFGEGAWANFYGATFGQGAGASFYGAIFQPDARADFFGAKFEPDARADFQGAIFHKGATAYFGGATLWDLDCLSGVFYGTADFSEAKFLKRATFPHWRFGPGSTFVGATGLENITFRNCNLALVSFRDSAAVDQVEFDNCDWGEPKRAKGLRGLWAGLTGEAGRRTVQDESEARGSRRREDYAAAERVYNQVRRSYESRRKYQEAMDFDYGEMEMRRLKEGRRLSLLTIYWLLSGYGHYWRKAAFWLVGALLLFALLHPLAGFQYSQGTDRYAVSLGSQAASVEALLGGAGQSVIYSLRNATLLKDPAYTPLNLAGHFLAIAENILGPLLLGLMGLAVRRKFRR